MHANQKATGSIHAHTTDQAMHAPKGKAQGKNTFIYLYQKPPKVADPQLSWSKLPWTGNLLEQSSLNANLIFGGFPEPSRTRHFHASKAAMEARWLRPLTHGSMANTSATTASSRLRVYINMYTGLKTKKAQNPPTEISNVKKRRQDKQTRKSADRCAKTFLHTVSGNFRRHEFPGILIII